MPVRPAPALLAASLAILLAPALRGVELRVATLNVGGDFGGGFGLGDYGTTDHDAVAAVLGRIDADVVTLQEIFDADLDGDPDDSSVSAEGTGFPDDLADLAATLGYAHRYTGYQTSLDPTLRCIFLSRFPITAAAAVDSLDPANEMTRVAPAIVVDVPGTDNDPTLIAVHLKAGTTSADRFRRAIEMRRVNDYLDAAGLGEGDNVIVLGDFNLDLDPGQIDFTSLPSGLSATFSLGSDVTFPVTYTEDPAFYLSTPALTRLAPTRLNGAVNSYVYGRTIDHILVSPAIAARGIASEIYDSQLDVDNLAGLPKSGAPLNDGTSFEASDHYAVVADLQLDGGLLLGASVSRSSVREDDPPGTARLVVTMTPAPGPAESVVVLLDTSDPGELTFATTALTFTTGDTSLSVDLVPQADGLVDGTRTVTLAASTTGTATAQATIDVLDADIAAYLISAAGQTLREDFNTFAGTAAPANWSTTAAPWRGRDDGSGALAGNYAYGTTEAALGVLPSAPAAFTARYFNDSGAPITALQVQFDAEHWRVVPGGAPAGWAVELLVGDSTTALGALTFWADTTGTPGQASTLATTLAGLAIPADTSFFLRFTATPGPGAGTPSAAVFINEFHYDNAGTDTGEFVEVVVGPGFARELSDIAIVRYNGSNGAAYTSPAGPGSLADFTPGAVVNEYRFLSYPYPQDGLQNGAPDGLAVVDTGTDPDTVLQFLSYEGSFTATSGPAAGLTSLDVGSSQTGSDAAGTGSIGLTGSGADNTGLSWTKFTGQAHTAGAPNPGQVLATPGAPPQGIAIDNLSLTVLVDTDKDGDPDLTDPDDDNDGYSDVEETAAGTDPLDPADFPAPAAGTPVITSASYDGGAEVLTILFQGGPGIASWRVEGAANPSAGFGDHPALLSLVESPPGTYTATIDLSGSGPSYFIRVARP